jgi:regulator of RNase E activity RraA
MTVRSGDVLVADRHGVLHIPDDVSIDDLVEAARTIDALEAEVFAYCQSGDFDVEEMARLDASVLGRWPGAAGPTR